MEEEVVFADSAQLLDVDQRVRALDLEVELKGLQLLVLGILKGLGGVRDV